MKKNSEQITLKKKTSRRKRRITTEETSIEDGDIEKEKNVLKKQQLITVCEKFARSIVKKQIEGLKAEFESLKGYFLDSPITFFSNNKNKNRFHDIMCLDKSRVVLRGGGSLENDYIHANHVTSDSCKLRSKFICTQGPLESTVQDFWRMVIQENVRHIIMLCQLYENNKPKCHQYYPINVGESKSFGNITITNVCEKANVDVGRHFHTFELLVSTGSAQDLRVCHYRCVDWPDFGVPETGIGILRVLREVRREKTPCIVHCSAGVGRTGTLMAIEFGVKHLLEKKDIKMVEIIKELRNQRAKCVQTEAQYIFIHRALMEFIKARKQLKETDEFFKMYADYLLTIKLPNNPQQLSIPPPLQFQAPQQIQQNNTMMAPVTDVSQQQQPDINQSIK